MMAIARSGPPLPPAIFIGSATTVMVDAVNRRGRTFQCSVRALPLLDRSARSYGVILLMSGPDGRVGDGSSGPGA